MYFKINAHSNETDTDCNIDNVMTCDCSFLIAILLISISRKLNCNLSLYHFNARSLNKHANDITNHLATLKCHFNIYDFTETWFRDNNDSNLVDFEGYSAVNCYRKGRSGGGATLFIDNDIEFNIREDLSIKCDDCDSIFIEFKRKEKALTRKIIIRVIYRPDYVELDTFYIF